MFSLVDYFHDQREKRLIKDDPLHIIQPVHIEKLNNIDKKLRNEYVIKSTLITCMTGLIGVWLSSKYFGK